MSLLFTQTNLPKAINPVLKNSIHKLDQLLFSKADISVQDFINDKGKKDIDKMYLVFGNPKTIKAEMEEARRLRLSEVKISTFSTQFFFFVMFYVPIIFLISIFIASPMSFKDKLKGLGISLLFLSFLLIVKIGLYTWFSIANERIGIYELSESGLSVLSFMVSSLSIGLVIIFCLCLWLYFGFRKSAFLAGFTSLFSTSN